MTHARTAPRTAAATFTTRRQARPLDPSAYGQPKPRFDIRELFRNFESEQDAEAERDARRRSLLRTGTAQGRRLAAALADCAPDERCLLGICPLCMRQLRVWATAQALELFNGEPELIAPTLVPARAAFPPGQLRAFDPRRFNDMLRQQLRRVGMGGEPIYGGVHGDYDAGRGLLQPHHHLIAPARLRPAFEELAARFYAADRGEVPGPAGVRVYRPVLIQTVRDRPAQVSYAQKGYWPRSGGWLDHEGRSRRGSASRLPEPLHGAWLLWRGRFGLADLMFLSGIRRYGGELRRAGSRDA